MTRPDVSAPPPRTTPLHAAHRALGARMTVFGGFDMPLQYVGIVAEHEAVRKRAGVFDTCHMGEIEIEGAGALALVERLVSADIAPLTEGQCRYALLCNETGGVLDDLIVYCLAPGTRYLLVVNASTRGRDAAWIAAHAEEARGVRVTDRSDELGKIDVQGPEARRVTERALGIKLMDLGYFRFVGPRTGVPDGMLISRTGYTGELGYELYAPADRIGALWERVLAEGAIPAGLGARDTLRLEMGLPLYGHELSLERNAAQSGFTRALSAVKPFLGSEWIRLSMPPTEKLTGIRFEGRRAARAGDDVLDAGMHVVGCVTSGSFGPSVGSAVALAYVRLEHAAPGSPLRVRGSRAELVGAVAELPFYRGGTARMKQKQAGAGSDRAAGRDKENENAAANGADDERTRACAGGHSE